ncbi:MAG: DUF2735 domain-containing protein [Hyphomicrobiaceae bacterium]|nr:DUF2735 domain-containing protein [Hyphomicrobiaceae bacterium]
MSEITPRHSATIVPFPAGGRAGLRRAQGRATLERVPGALPLHGAMMAGSNAVVATAGWYHDAAIAEAVEPSRD